MRFKIARTLPIVATAIVLAYGMLADDKKPVNNQNNNRPATPTHNSPPPSRPVTPTAPTRTAPPNATRTPSTPSTSRPTYTPNTPSTSRPTYTPNTPSTSRPTYTPNTTRPSGTTPGGSRSPGGTIVTPPATGSGGTYTPGGNPRGGPGTGTPAARPGGTYPPGANPRTYTPGANSRPGGTYTPSSTTNGRTFGRTAPTFRPPAGAVSSRGPNGGTTWSRGGMNYHTDRSGRLASISRPGMEAHYSSSGAVRSASFVRSGGARVTVRTGYYGERHVETIRADRSRVVAWGAHAGFVERPYRAGYVSRTYVVGSTSYVRVYRTYSYRGAVYYGYQPPIFYQPVFYGWAYNPWPRPIMWGWGWRASPWFGFYAGFFSPAPYYPTASLWLTDYLIAEDLRIAYENRMAAMAAADAQYEPPPPAPTGQDAVMLSPAVKDAIAQEVRAQLEAERAAAGQPPPPVTNTALEQPPAALDPNQRIFVVSTNFAANAAGQECALTPGDIIVRTSDALSPQNTVGVSVLSSKPGDCPMNATAEVEVAQLCEMHNQFQDHVDNGLKMLADNQGRNGLPPGPAPDPRNSPTGYAQGDSAASVNATLLQTEQDANQALSEAQQAAAGQ